VDITSITTGHVVVYPAATTDWFSRPVLAWRLSITLEAEVWPVMVAAARSGGIWTFTIPAGHIRAWGVDAGASPSQPYAAAHRSKEIRPVPEARSNEAKPIRVGQRRQHDAHISLQGLHRPEPNRCRKRPSGSTGLQFSSTGGSHYLLSEIARIAPGWSVSNPVLPSRGM